MKFLKIVTVTAAAAMFAACSSGSPAANQNAAAGSTGNSAVKPAAEKPAVGPADTLRALSEASNKKDVEGIKRHLSRGTIERLEEGAKIQEKSADQLLMEKDGAPFPVLPELGAETISGDTATLEVKNSETNKFEKLPFVLEDGRWKVAIDKYLDDLDAEHEEPAKKP